MPLTDGEQRTLADDFATRAYVRLARTAGTNREQLQAAFVAVDGHFALDLATARTTYGGTTTVLNSFVQALPAEVRNNTTAAEKWAVLALYALKQAGMA